MRPRWKSPLESCSLRHLEYSVNVSHMEMCTGEGESPVQHLQEFLVRGDCDWVGLLENAALMGGKLHPSLNTGERPIVNKYREGKIKSTLKRGWKAPETATGEAYCISERLPHCSAVSAVYSVCVTRGDGCVLWDLFVRVHGEGIPFSVRISTKWCNSTRLETRTKEFSNAASRRGVGNP